MAALLAKYCTIEDKELELAKEGGKSQTKSAR